MNKTRRERGPDRWHFAFLFLILIATGTASATNPWVHTFNPIRTLYVSPNGNGDGSQGNPMSFTTAINTAVPGDLYIIMAGSYSGQKILSRDGTASNPIVWRAEDGAMPLLNGRIEASGDHNWVWGLEIKDPNGNGTGDGIAVYGTGVHAINNIVHDLKGGVGIGAWNTGSGHVVYGNIIYKQVPNSNNPHNIYTQNDFATRGYKYIVANMLLDSWDATGNTYNFHAYTQGNSISGFHAEKNIVRKGKFLIGGTGLPADNEIVRENYFYNAPVLFGWSIPAQVKFENNYLGRATLDSNFFWGVGEVVYPQTAQSVFTGNQIHFPPGNHINFRTSAFMPGQCNGCPEIRAGDTFNNNTYSSPFNASFFADNNNAGTVSFSTWKTVSANAGNQFDLNSTVVTSTPNRIVVLPNEYETGRGHIAIFNWSLSSTVTVDLSSVLSNGSDFQILDPRNLGSPVLTGTYSGPVNIPTGGLEFMALLVLGNGAAPPPPPPDTTAPDTTITSSFCGTTVTTTSVTVNWTGTDNVTPTGNLVYAYALDGGSYSSYGSATSHTFNNLSQGSHTVSVKAKDEAGNVDASPAQCSFTVSVADTTPPVISNIIVSNVLLNSATITWDTNEPSDSQVEYGTAPCPCGTNSPLNPALTTAHSVVLNGLSSNTTYHYRVKSRDASGNLGISNDRTFTTGNNPPPPPGQVAYYLEPEAGALVVPMDDDGNGDASNHKVVKTSAEEQGSATFLLDIPVAGTYVFWARVKAPTPEQDSFYVSADNGAEDIFDCAMGNQSPLYQWSRVNGRNGGAPGTLNPRTFSFTAGLHTLEFRGREAGTELDMILVTNDLGFVPPENAANTVLFKILPKKITSSTVKIKWKSEMPANSLVEYGTTTQYGSTTALDSNMVEKHKVPLENLQSNTIYHYRVKSVDGNGNQWVSADFTFLTLP